MRRTTRATTRATTMAIAAIASAALLGCAPGSLSSGEPTSSAATSDPAATQTREPSPSGTTASPDATTASTESVLLATLAASDGLAIVDPGAVEPLLDVVEVGQAPWGVAAHDGVAYVTTAEGLAIVDLATRTRTALVPYLHQPTEITFGEYRDGGLGLAVAPDGERVYVAVHAWPAPAWLEVFDVTAGRFEASADVGIRPFDVLTDPAGGWVATIDHDSYTVSIVDPQTLEVRQSEIAPFGNLGFAGWEKPHYAALTADGRIALPYQGLVTVLLDPATGATERVETAANSHQHGVATAPDGTLVTAGTGPFGTATGSPNASFLEPTTGRERVVALERPHETVAIWQPGDGTWQAVLAGGFTRDGWWDGLTLVDPSSGDIREIPVEGRPQNVIAAVVPAP